MAEILAVRVEHRPGRTCPRAVKRPISPFPGKAKLQRPEPTIRKRSIHILPPAHAGSACVEKPVVQDPRAYGDAFWWRHVRAWHRTGQTRAAYCRKHDLPLQSFQAAVARLRHRLRRPAKQA